MSHANIAKTELAPKLTAAADREIERSALLANPYFARLEDGSMSLDAFRRSQEQFYHAVAFFPRPMAALVGRIPDPRMRLDILHNVVEEHGEFDPTGFHEATFRRFLRAIGNGSSDPQERAPWPAVRAFNSVLTTACVLDELEVGVSTMGVIEYAFAEISSLIGRAVVARGWIPEGELVHYKLHAEIDKRHAAEFFVVVEEAWNEPERRYFIEQGLALGVYAFGRLYRDLLEAAVQARP